MAASSSSERVSVSSPPPLHRAVQSGRVEEVRSLILGGADPNLRYQGHTPLQAAALRGRLKIVEALVELGGDVNVLTPESSTLLHIAVLSRNPGLIQFFANQPSCRTWLTHRDFQCKTPYEKALQLHLDGEIIGMLNPSPLQPSTIPSTSTSTGLPPDPIDQSPERAFRIARESKDLFGQISALEKLSDLCVEKREYLNGARLLNAALSLVKKDEHPKQYTDFILKLEEIERLFLESLGGIVPADYRSNIVKYREILEEARKHAQKQLDKEQAIRKIQANLTREFKRILTALINESNHLLGGELQDFAVIVFGSMAREETSPYSDLEFAFLTRNLDPQNLNRLRRLSQLLTLKVINIGETYDGTVELPASGFCVDIGGTSPQGGDGVCGELIGSPDQLAQFQSKEWYDRHGHSVIPTVNALRTASYLVGDENLLQEYQGRIQDIYASSPLFSRVKLMQSRALQFIGNFVAWFAPRLDQSRTEQGFFNVKEDFYRLPQTVISALALYFSITSANTFDQLKELRIRRVISVEGAAKLKKVLIIVLRLRVQAHLFYKTEKEDVSRSRRNENLLRIRKKELIEIYRVLIPFHKSAQDFLNGNRAAFAQPIFDDQSFSKTALGKVVLKPDSWSARARLGQNQKKTGEIEASVTNFEAAQRLFQGDPMSFEYARLLKNLGEAYLLSGAFEKAITPLTSAKLLYQGAAGAEFKILAFFGEAYLGLGQFEEANHCYAELGTMYLSLPKSDKKRELRVRSLLNSGLAYYRSSDFESAIVKFKSYLAKKRKENPELYSHPIDPSILQVLHRLSLIYRDQGNLSYARGDFSGAIIKYKSLLKLQRKCYVESSPEIVSTLELLADANFKDETYDEASKLYEILLPIQRRNRSEGQVLHTLSCLGESYYKEGENKKSIGIYEDLLKKQQSLLRRPSLEIAETLTHLAKAYRRISNLQKAVECYGASLEERRKLRQEHGSAELEDSIKETKEKRRKLLKEIRKSAH